MSAKELTQYVGKLGGYRVGELRVNVRILDARVSFGRLDLEIAPIAGNGAQWVSADSVKLES